MDLLELRVQLQAAMAELLGLQELVALEMSLLQEQR
jgi:hypothetical protein